MAMYSSIAGPNVSLLKRLRLRRNHKTSPTTSKNTTAPMVAPATMPPTGGEDALTTALEVLVGLVLEATEDVVLLIVVEAQCVNVLFANCAWVLVKVCRVYSLEESLIR